MRTRTLLLPIVILAALANTALAQVPVPRVLSADPTTVLGEARLHQWPPFLHWDLREFPGCRVPWALAPMPVPDFDGNGTPNLPPDRTIARNEFAASFAVWQAVDPALIGFVSSATAAPGPGGIAMDGHNTIGFGDGDLDDVQVAVPGAVVAAGDTIVAPGPNGVLESQPGGDDIVVGAYIVDGGNLVADSFANTWGSVAGALAMTGLFFNNQSGVIIEADVVFDNGFTWVINPATNDCANSTFNLRGTAIHEIGHFIGIAHPILANPAAADVADGVTPNMHATACPAFDLNNFDQSLENSDKDSCNFLYGPDLGDAPDPWMGVIGQYPSLVHEAAKGRTLNGIKLDKKLLGAEHIFGIARRQPARNFTYEWLGRRTTSDVDAECEANVVDADPYDDGVTWYPNPPIWGRKLTVVAWMRYATDQFGNSHNYLARPLFANAWLDVNQNCIWEEHFLHKSRKPVLPLLPNLVQLTVASGSIGLPKAVDSSKPVWLRVRLDHGEDVGQVRNIDGTLDMDKGAAQFGEVEDYPFYCKRPTYEQHWLCNPFPFPVPGVSMVVVGPYDPSDITFSAQVDAGDCILATAAVNPPVFSLASDETMYRYPVPGWIPPNTYWHYGICRAPSGEPLTVLRPYFNEASWPDEYSPSPQEVLPHLRIPAVNVSYRPYSPGYPHYGNAKFTVGAVDIENGGWIELDTLTGSWNDSLRVSVSYRVSPTPVPLQNLSPCDPLYLSLPLTTVGVGYVTPEDGFDFDVTEAELLANPVVIVEVESSWNTNGTTNRQIIEFDGVEESTPVAGSPAPHGLVLENYPNPFNPGTTVRFAVPDRGAVTLAVYDVGGRLVRALLQEATMNAGFHEVSWDGRDDRGAEMASGVYFFRIQTARETLTRKAVLLK